jgi:hypothetical protein
VLRVLRSFEKQFVTDQDDQQQRNSVHEMKQNVGENLEKFLARLRDKNATLPRPFSAEGFHEILQRNSDSHHSSTLMRVCNKLRRGTQASQTLTNYFQIVRSECDMSVPRAAPSVKFVRSDRDGQEEKGARAGDWRSIADERGEFRTMSTTGERLGYNSDEEDERVDYSRSWADPEKAEVKQMGTFGANTSGGDRERNRIEEDARRKGNLAEWERDVVRTMSYAAAKDSGPPPTVTL